MGETYNAHGRGEKYKILIGGPTVDGKILQRILGK
jgi:hypothetical protein